MKSRVSSALITLLILFACAYHAYADSKITNFDAKSVNSAGLPDEVKKRDAANYAPYESFSMSKRKKVDLTLLTDYSGAKLNDPIARINNLKASLNSKNVDLSVNVIGAESAFKIGDQTRPAPFLSTSGFGFMEVDYGFINNQNIFVVNPHVGYIEDTQMVMNVEDAKTLGTLMPYYYNAPASSWDYKKYGFNYLVKTYDGQLYRVLSEWYKTTYSEEYHIEKELIKSGVKSIGNGGLYIDNNNRLYKYTRYSLEQRICMIDTDTTPIAENVARVYCSEYDDAFNETIYSDPYSGKMQSTYRALGYITTSNTLYGVVIKYYGNAKRYSTDTPPPEQKEIRTYKIADNVLSADFTGNVFTYIKSDGSMWGGILDAGPGSGLSLSPSPILTNAARVKIHCNDNDFYRYVITSDNNFYKAIHVGGGNFTAVLLGTNVKDADCNERSILVLHTDGHLEAFYAYNSSTGPIDSHVDIRFMEPLDIAEIRFTKWTGNGACNYILILKDGRIIEAEYREGNVYARKPWDEAFFAICGVNSRYYGHAESINGQNNVYMTPSLNNYFYRVQSLLVPATSIYSVNTGGVAGITPRPDSDRYFICLADGTGNDYRGGLGSYFSFGNMNRALMTYLIQNRYSVYAVTNPQAYDYILPDLGKQEVSIRQLVGSSSAEGVYYPPGQLQQALDRINGKYTVSETVENYALLNEELTINNVYGDGETDPRLSLLYRITHVDPNYFKNPMGVMPNSGGYIGDPVLKFDRTGKYELTIHALDNPKTDSRFDNYKLWSNGEDSKYILYVHRKPVAQFSASFSGTDAWGNYITNVSESSYDLDHTDRVDKGISARQWRWKNITGDGWTNGLPYALAPNQTYLLELQVQDIDGAGGHGAWGDPAVQAITTSGNNFPPSVDATPTGRDWANVDITCNIIASDPNGDYSYTNYAWSTSAVKPVSGWQGVASANFNVSQYLEGAWYLHMEAFDGAGNSFYRVRGPYLIDKTPPAVSGLSINVPYYTNASEYTITASNVTDNLSGVSAVRFPTWTSYNGQDDLLQPWTSYYPGSADGSGNWYYTVRASDHYNEDGLYITHYYAWDKAGNYQAIAAPSVVIDRAAPVIDSSPVSGSFSSVTLSASDATSGIANVQYAWSTSTARPSTGWTTINCGGPLNYNTSLPVPDDGNSYYLHMQATDQAGNSYYRYRGTYNVLTITGVTLTGYWNHWRGQVETWGNPNPAVAYPHTMTVEPHRFLSLECVKIDVTTAGDPDYVVIRFSPELEALQYTDPHGNVYDYNTDYFHYYVRFPQDSTIVPVNNHVYWEYSLPLAPSTKGWDDIRKRPQYSMTVTAWKGASSVTYTINDIDITGNIYELSYIQPLN